MDDYASAATAAARAGRDALAPVTTAAGTLAHPLPPPRSPPTGPAGLFVIEDYTAKQAQQQHQHQHQQPQQQAKTPVQAAPGKPATGSARASPTLSPSLPPVSPPGSRRPSAAPSDASTVCTQAPAPSLLPYSVHPLYLPPPPPPLQPLRWCRERLRAGGPSGGVSRLCVCVGVSAVDVTLGAGLEWADSYVGPHSAHGGVSRARAAEASAAGATTEHYYAFAARQQRSRRASLAAATGGAALAREFAAGDDVALTSALTCFDWWPPLGPRAAQELLTADEAAAVLAAVPRARKGDRAARVRKESVRCEIRCVALRHDTAAAAPVSPGDYVASRTAFAVATVTVLDCVAASIFRKLLTFLPTRALPSLADPNARGDAVPMLSGEVAAMRAGRRGARDELRVRVYACPLKANADQDTVEMLVKVGSEAGAYRATRPDLSVAALGGEDTLDDEEEEEDDDGAGAGAGGNDKEEEEEDDLDLADGSDDTTTTKKAQAAKTDTTPTTTTSSSKRGGGKGGDTVAAAVYIQRLDVGALVLCVDYAPKRLSFAALQQGNVAELAHLFPLQDLLVTLPALKLEGLRGGGELGAALLARVLQTIPAQAAAYVAAIRPVRAVAEAAAGVADLVILPLAQLRTEKGSVRDGLLRGARSLGVGLTKATLTATVQAVSLAGAAVAGVGALFGPDPLAQRLLEARRHRVARSRKGLAGGIEDLDDEAEALLEAEASMVSAVATSARVRAQRPPRSLSEGVSQGYEALADALQRAGHNIVAIPSHDYQTAGAGRAALSVIRALPAAVLQPIAGTATAVARVAMGAAHGLDPLQRTIEDDKYK